MKFKVGDRVRCYVFEQTNPVLTIEAIDGDFLTGSGVGGGYSKIHWKRCRRLKKQLPNVVYLKRIPNNNSLNPLFEMSEHNMSVQFEAIWPLHETRRLVIKSRTTESF